MKKAALALRRLERIKTRYGPELASRKESLIRELAGRSFDDPDKVVRYHETLCFLRAYPDSPAVLSAVESTLESFSERRDVARFKSALTNTGIAGTNIDFQFYWFMACWLARRFPKNLSVKWDELENESLLENLLHLLVTYSESPGIDELDFGLREWIDNLKGPDETDAQFLIRRFEALTPNAFGQETLFEEVDIPFRLAPGPKTPSRTHAKYRMSPVVYQTGPLSTARPDLREEIRRPPLGVRDVHPREAERLIDMAREAMVSRTRDLDVFVHAGRNDVRIIDCGEGLEFVCFGAKPERRLLLESVYGYLTLRSGVPTGYVLTSQFFGSAGIAYNVFDTYRGTDAAATFGRVLGMVNHLFSVDAYFMPPYQLGHDNEEGLKSGAWWFYYKLRFRPEDAGVRRLLRQELARMKRNRKHRSSISTLQKLTAENMYFYLNDRREDILGKLRLANAGLRIARYLAKRFGAERERGIRTCSREVAELLELGSLTNLSPGERLAWDRWSPLVLILPGVEKWSKKERRDLARVVRAKGGGRESDFVRLFDRHKKLRRALVKLMSAT
jgi:hypothetical protein